MTLTFAELQILLEALDMSISRHQSCADYYDKRPGRFSRNAVGKHSRKSEAMQVLACKFSQLKPRRDLLEVA